MTRPVQITFRNMRASASIEDQVRARIAWLERFHPDLVGCRVLLEVPHRHHEHGQHVRVRIEMSLPGKDAVVNHEPTLHGHSKDVQEEAHHKDTDIDPAHKLAPVAIRNAFDTARRRLEDSARRRYGPRSDSTCGGSQGREGLFPTMGNYPRTGATAPGPKVATDNGSQRAPSS